MTSTEEEQTVVINVTPIAHQQPPVNTTVTPPAVAAVVPRQNVKRNRALYYYGVSATTKIPPLRRLLGKKAWHEVKAIVYEDSTLKVFEDEKLRDAVFEIKLENVALKVAFGKAANKYDPPPITEDECNYVSSNNFFAVPESNEAKKVHWFAAKDEKDLEGLIEAIAETLDGKVKPPLLGKGAKYRHTSPEDSVSQRWKTYWLTQAITAGHHMEPNAVLLASDENGTNGTNGTNGAQSEHKFVATPLVAVLEHQKEQEHQRKIEEQKIELSHHQPEKKVEEKTTVVVTDEKAPSPTQTTPPSKNGFANKFNGLFNKPSPQPRPQHNYYAYNGEMPENASTLVHDDCANSLCDHGRTDEDAKITHFRLVNGKRVKEVIAANPTKKQDTTTGGAEESAPNPPDYPPPPVPALVLDGESKPNGGHRTHHSPKIHEVTTTDKSEPLIISTKRIDLAAARMPPAEINGHQHQEQSVEVVTTSQHNAVINVASVEHVISSTTEYVTNNGLSCTTTKETTTYQQEAVH